MKTLSSTIKITTFSIEILSITIKITTFSMSTLSLPLKIMTLCKVSLSIKTIIGSYYVKFLTLPNVFDQI
jgi:hypothetical protein